MKVKTLESSYKTNTGYKYGTSVIDLETGLNELILSNRKLKKNSVLNLNVKYSNAYLCYVVE